MKVIALVCMLIDHIGLVFFPSQMIWRVIGRIAMPIFAFGIARGAYYTHSMPKYMKKMLIFALISQIPYNLVAHIAWGAPFPGMQLNVGFTFLIALLILNSYKKYEQTRRKPHIVDWLACFVLLLSADLLRCDYGSYGVLMVIVCYLIKTTPYDWKQMLGMMLGYTVITYLAYGGSSSFLLQEVGVMAFLVIYGLKNVSEKRIGQVFYLFYPLHLLILYWIKVR